MAAQATLPPQAADALRAHAAGPGRRRSSPRSRARCPTTRGRWRAASARPCASASQVALNRFVDLLAGEARKDASARDTYAAARRGRVPPGPHARRAAGRLPRRRDGSRGGASSTSARSAGFPPDALYDLGEAMFAYIDEISAESAAGFAEAQSEAAGESQRRRRRLLRLLVQEPPAAGRGRAHRRAGRGLGAAAPASPRSSRPRPTSPRASPPRTARRGRARRSPTGSRRGWRGGSARARSAPRSAGSRS